MSDHNANQDTAKCPELWKVVPGQEADDWGISRTDTPSPFKDIAQMMDEEDASDVVRLHNESAKPALAPLSQSAERMTPKEFWVSGKRWMTKFEFAEAYAEL